MSAIRALSALLVVATCALAADAATLRVPAEPGRLQAALDRAAAGDVIELEEGSRERTLDYLQSRSAG